MLFDRQPCPPRLEPVALEGSLVRLEPLSREHLDDLWVAAASDPRIWTYMPVVVHDREDLERVVDAALSGQQNGLGMAYAVVDRATNTAIGSSRYLDYRPADRGVEIGWTWYHVDFWGSPINPEEQAAAAAARIRDARLRAGPVENRRTQCALARRDFEAGREIRGDSAPAHPGAGQLPSEQRLFQHPGRRVAEPWSGAWRNGSQLWRRRAGAASR